MGITNIFKKKRKEEKSVEEIGVKPRTETGEESAKEMVGVQPRSELAEAYRILKAPQVTEKATDLAKRNQYVFKVFPKANKVEIKKAIENLYGVNVLSVKIVKIPRKKRRLGRISGWRKGYKKAIVKIKGGQKIEVLPR